MLLPLLISCALATLSDPAQTNQTALSKRDNVPDTLPYNLMYTPDTDSLPSNHRDYIRIPIDAIHKKARVVFKDDTEQEVIGIDMFVKGSPLFMDIEQRYGFRDECVHYNLFNLDIPLEPSSWSSADASNTFKTRKFSSREKMMRNEFSDYYFRFRCPQGADYEETKQIVEQLNVGHRSLNGFSRITNFTVFTGSFARKYFGSRPAAGTVSTLYLDAEYESLGLSAASPYVESSLSWKHYILAPLIGIVFLISFICVFTTKSGAKVFLVVLALSLVVIETLVWDGLAKMVKLMY